MKPVLRIQRPQKRGVSHVNIFKRLIYPIFSMNGPGAEGAFHQISPDVVLTTCIQLYSEGPKKAIFSTQKTFDFDAAPPR